MSQERLEEDDDPRLNDATLHADVASTITEMVSSSKVSLCGVGVCLVKILFTFY